VCVCVCVCVCVYTHTHTYMYWIRKRKANWIGHILRRNCLLKEVIEGKIKGEIEVIRIRGRRRKKLLDDLKDGREYSHLKEEALVRTIRRNRFGRGVGPVVRQITEWMNISVNCLMCTSYLNTRTYILIDESPLYNAAQNLYNRSYCQ
jgi:hypothetical protein